MTTTSQHKSSLFRIFLTGVASLTLIVCVPQAFAQHGGGGSSHGSSGGGGFHGASVGHEGGFSGGYHGGEGSSRMYGGARGGMSGTRPEGMSRESTSRGGERGSAYGRADTSPGWHSMGGSSRTGRSWTIRQHGRSMQEARGRNGRSWHGHNACSAG